MTVPPINPKGVGSWVKMRWKKLGPLPIWYPEERPFAVTVFMLGTVMWFTLILIGVACRGPNWEWYWPWEAWSYRRLTKLTLKNLPNLWGGLLLVSYFLLGSPIPKKKKASAALHLGLGLAMAAALFLPLLFAPDADYPMRSRYTTLLEALGRSINAPVVSGMYHVIQQLGPAAGYAVIAAGVAVVGLLLGAAGMVFAKFKDRLYEALGPIKYAIVIGLFLIMMGVLGKIVLRLLFGIKYLIHFPTVNFNI